MAYVIHSKRQSGLVQALGRQGCVVRGEFHGLEVDHAVWRGHATCLACFSKCSFIGTVFHFTKYRSRFDGCLFEGSLFARVFINASVFYRCCFRSVVFYGAEFDGTTFVGCQFEDVLVVNSRGRVTVDDRSAWEKRVSVRSSSIVI